MNTLVIWVIYCLLADAFHCTYVYQKYQIFIVID